MTTPEAKDVEMARLDALLKAARASPPDLPAELAARVLADARAVQPVPARRMRNATARWRRFLPAFGGWQAAGGLAMAACTGFWFGFSAPVGGEATFMGAQADEFEAELDDIIGLDWDISEGIDDAG